MIREDNKTYHYHAIIDKDNNVMNKFPSKSYAVRVALNNPRAVAVKEVTHIINEEVVWTKGKINENQNNNRNNRN